MAITRFGGTAAVAGSTLSVYLAGTQAVATIYADALLTPQANPFTTDPVTGEWAFYADDAVAYDIDEATAAQPPLPPALPADAPAGAPYILELAYAGLPNARRLIDTASVAWSFAVAGQASAAVLPAGVSILALSGFPGGSTTFLRADGTFAAPTSSGAPADQTYVTVTDQTAALANSRRLVAGTNVSFNTGTPGQLVVNATGGAGGGDVSGPASAVDDRIATFDGTTGKIIQDGGQTIAEVITSAVAAAAAAIVPIDLATDVTGDLPFANLTPATAASRLLGRGSAAGAGDFQEVTLGAGLTMTGTELSASASGTGFLSGSGNPQGVVAADVGRMYFDTATGYLYVKRGGGVTAYGWYYQPPIGADYTVGPRVFLFNEAAESTALLEGGGLGNRLSTSGATIRDWPTISGNSATVAELARADGWYQQGQQFTLASGNTVYIASTASVVNWWDYDFDATIRIVTDPTNTLTRIWWGVVSSAITNSDANAGNAIVFRYSTAVPDAGWVGYTRTTVGPASSVTATVAAIAADTTYRLRIRFIRSGTPTVYFSVNDGTEIAKTTDIPATGTASFWTYGVTTLTNAARLLIYRAQAVVSGDLTVAP